jgi:hypothetical protein
MGKAVKATDVRMRNLRISMGESVMSTQNRLDMHGILDAQLAVRLESLCRELTHTGELQMKKMASSLDEAAPNPGALVYLRTKRLSVKLNGLEPVVFSAIDACTFLQVAQIYLVETTAAAASFFDFVVQTLPFTVVHLRSRNQRPFYYSSGDRSYHDFTELVGEKGCAHSLISTNAQDPLFGIAEKFMFGGISEGSVIGGSEGELQRELVHFLFFHNNYRSIPWLQGKTPVQKLASFSAFPGWHSFDPYRSPMANVEARDTRRNHR